MSDVHLTDAQRELYEETLRLPLGPVALADVAARVRHAPEHLYRDVRGPRIHEGANEIQREIIVRDVPLNRYDLLDRALGAGLLPDAVLRAGTRAGIRMRLGRERRGGVEAQEERLRALVAHMSSGPIAELPAKANEQHYELPAEFLGLFLGPRRKYSCCLFANGTEDLAAAENAMLALTCERAGIHDGMTVLDLGCGWGALSLWMSEHYPTSQIVAVSNSHGQREWIESQLRGRDNLRVVTADINEFAPEQRFDRVVSVEMFEHARNWAALLKRVAGWLEPDGRAFIHVFSHRNVAYRFEDTWAAERFFTAGLMPSHDLLLRFNEDLVVTDRWAVSGEHYARTLRAWLARLDGRRAEALAILGDPKLLATWRLFLICTGEIWGWRGGDEWLVSHYLLEPS